LLPLRTALVLLLAVLAGIDTSVLILLTGRTGSEAALVGVGVLAAARKFFHWLIA
jgi:hypothetical protein